MNLKPNLLRVFSSYDEAWLRFGVIATTLSLLMPILVLAVINFYPSPLTASQLQNMANIGDFLAGTTFLLAFASIIFVVASIQIQQKELQATKLEMAKSNDHYEHANRMMQEQLEQSTEQHKASLENQKLQHFETTYFNLIHLLIQTRSNQISHDDLGDISYLDAIKRVLTSMKEHDGYLPDQWYADYLFSGGNPDEKWKDIKNFLGHFKEPDSEEYHIEHLFAYLEELVSYGENTSHISSHYEVKYEDLANIYHQDDDEINPFLSYLFDHTDELMRDLIHDSFVNSKHGLVKSISAYHNTLNVILKYINTKRDKRQLYFDIFIAQLTLEEVEYLKYIVYYELNREISDGVEKIDDSFAMFQLGRMC